MTRVSAFVTRHDESGCDVDAASVTELIQSPHAAAILSDVDILCIAFQFCWIKIGNDATRGASPRVRISTPQHLAFLSPSVILLESSLRASSKFSKLRLEEMDDRLRKAAAATSTHFRLDGSVIHLLRAPSVAQQLLQLESRLPICHAMGLIPHPYPGQGTPLRFELDSIAFPPTGTLVVTPAGLRKVLAKPRTAPHCCDVDWLVIAVLLAAKMAPQSGQEFAPEVLVREIESYRVAWKLSESEANTRLIAAARAVSCFSITWFRQHIRLVKLELFHEVLAEIVLRPAFRGVLEELQQEATERAKEEQRRNAKIPLPPPKPPRPPKPMRLEMPPAPPAGRVTAHYTTMSTDALQPLLAAPIPLMKLSRETAKPAQARAIAERFALRNGLVEIQQVSMGTGIYLIAKSRFQAKGAVGDQLLQNAEESAIPVTLVVGPAGEEPEEIPDVSDESAVSEMTMLDEAQHARVAKWIETRQRTALTHAMAPMIHRIEMRRADRHAQIVARHATMAASVSSQVGDDADAEVERIAMMRDAELDGLAKPWPIEVTIHSMTVTAFSIPVVLVQTTCTRRKSKRSLTLRIAAGSKSVNRLACEACGGVTSKPAACDGAFHLLCEVCAPHLSGRIECAVCG